jgi:hypothetical protein
MGVSYAPFDDPVAPRPPSYSPPVPSKGPAGFTMPERDSTECNYIIMFFVIGVFAIALTDSLKSSH